MTSTAYAAKCGYPPKVIVADFICAVRYYIPHLWQGIGRLLHLRISAKTLDFGSSVMFPSASSDTDFTTVDLAYSSKTALFTGKAVNRAFF